MAGLSLEPTEKAKNRCSAFVHPRFEGQLTLNRNIKAQCENPGEVVVRDFSGKPFAKLCQKCFQREAKRQGWSCSASALGIV